MLYAVDASKYDHYLRKVRRVWTIRFFIIATIGTILFYFNPYLYNTPIWIWLAIIAVICVAYFWGYSRWTEELKKFKDAKYDLTFEVLTMYKGLESPRQINLSDIAILHRKIEGTLLVVGNWWTRFNYYRSQRGSIDNHDRIFIPSATNGYEELVKEIIKHWLTGRP